MLGLGLGLGLALALKLGLDLATKVILTTTSSTFTISNVHTPFDASELWGRRHVLYWSYMCCNLVVV